MSGDTLKLLEANVQAALDLAEALDELADTYDLEDLSDETLQVLEHHGIEDLEGRDPAELFDELFDVAVLEVYGRARVDAHGVDVQAIVVVTGVGGPHIEFEVNYGGGVRLPDWRLAAPVVCAGCETAPGWCPIHDGTVSL